MKTAQEWHSKFGASEEYTAMWDSHCVQLIREIQLDAFKAGAEWAAKQCDNELNIVLGASKHTANKIKQNILSASSNLKEIPK